MGLISGILWFKVGEYFDDFLGNFVSWFILPAVLPLIISLAIVFAGFRQKTTITYGILFLILYYVFHWVPLVIFFILMCFNGTH
jgi:hypothetical protein